jgi:RNA polymerase-interacting CarD/CdnL/TRCF family regulator
MVFQIGDKVIHSTFGLGEIEFIEEKTIHGQLTNCYVVHIKDITTWVPINELQQQTLRAPTPPDEFERLSAILSGPGETLQADRLQRKDELLVQIRDGQLSSICRVVRNLTCFKRSKRLNEQENTILERAINSLLTEWTYSQGIPLTQARQALTDLLGE